MVKLRQTMLVTFDWDPETGEMEQISSKLVDESKATPKTTTKKASKATTIEDQDNPGIIREDGKLILSAEAVELLGAEPDDRICIAYDKFGSGFKPFISIDEKKGNKLTKSNTVSYRGKANDELAYYGEKFKLTPGKHNGTFYLEGDKEINYSTPEGIEVDEDPISNDLDITLDLDDTKTKQITSFTFDDIDLE